MSGDPVMAWFLWVGVAWWLVTLPLGLWVLLRPLWNPELRPEPETDWEWLR